MSPSLSFAQLESLKSQLSSLRRTHVFTMTYYVSEPQTGFWHQPNRRFKSSLSSTATCVSSLVGARLWNSADFPLRGRAADIAKELIQKRTSAGLPCDNPFSLSFVAEGVLDLRDAEPQYDGNQGHYEHILNTIIPKLKDHLNETDRRLAQRGSISIEPYPLRGI